MGCPVPARQPPSGRLLEVGRGRCVGSRVGRDRGAGARQARLPAGPLDPFDMNDAVVRELLEEWQLTPDGEPNEVVPVRTRGGRPAVLKLGAAEHEHLALQHWHGRGAVQLLRADPRRFALLLERLHPEDLGDLWDVEACEFVGGLYESLHVAAPPQLRTLTSYAERWAGELDALPRDAPLPRRLVEQAASLGRDLAQDEASTGRMIHTELHYDNVLAGD